ncbi:MAG: right-handed parallel beta-helix repeat-containing protein [Spirochaetes bacterium]|nr:right-handed parallel beta-helix repeat-containing protein [Spirochaetota bacterium]
MEIYTIVSSMSRRFILFIILLPGLSLYSADYYIKTNGTDGLSGTSWAQAWRSLQYSASNLSPGDTVTVSNGTYFEQVYIYSNGSAGNPITFRSFNPGQAIVDGTGKDSCFYLEGKSYITIDGFTIKHATNYGISMEGISINNFVLNNIISSNNTYGIHINADESDNNLIFNNTIFGTNQNRGIIIYGGDHNLIKSNRIHSHNNAGIGLHSGAYSNQVVKNAIYSNNYYGVIITSLYNYILTNDIFSTNQRYGIYVSQGRFNIIRSNRIHRNDLSGVQIDMDASTNYIIRNSIYSNLGYGVYNNTAFGEYNYVLSNDIYGSRQSVGIYLGNNDLNIVKGNSFHHHSRWGISITGLANRHYIGHNEIYSNEVCGIYLYGNITNYIMTNHIWGDNQDYGIYYFVGSATKIHGNIIHNQKTNGIFMTNSDNIEIYHNLIYNNRYDGIRIIGASTGNEIMNNTLHGSIYSNGVRWEDTSGGFMYNNIIAFNGNESGDFGINNAGTGNIQVSYNDIFGNAGGQTNGSLIWGNGNIFLDPLIETSGFFRITTNTSPAVDSASNIPGITDNYTGKGPDMGWLEFVSRELTEEMILPVDVAVFPNYLDLSRGESAKIVFGKEYVTEIIIYTLSGYPVKSFPKQNYSIGEYQVWDGTINDTGKKAGAGLYIILVKGDNIDKKLKLIIKK